MAFPLSRHRANPVGRDGNDAHNDMVAHLAQQQQAKLDVTPGADAVQQKHMLQTSQLSVEVVALHVKWLQMFQYIDPNAAATSRKIDLRNVSDRLNEAGVRKFDIEYEVKHDSKTVTYCLLSLKMQILRIKNHSCFPNLHSVS